VSRATIHGHNVSVNFSVFFFRFSFMILVLSSTRSKLSATRFEYGQKASEPRRQSFVISAYVAIGFKWRGFAPRRHGLLRIIVRVAWLWCVVCGDAEP
jgi:hypothetical protein